MTQLGPTEAEADDWIAAFREYDGRVPGVAAGAGLEDGHTSGRRGYHLWHPDPDELAASAAYWIADQVTAVRIVPRSRLARLWDHPRAIDVGLILLALGAILILLTSAR